ncbi:uncharacterized protein LOC134412378 [Elgaria multicarinata webbii]|uniref:uncharacterized protein LOC134412378 n=1 Tax=Elgaria multicarinata webbii TaxID=159646 RepID=UPI002FCD496E
MAIWSLVLLSFSGALAQTNLNGKVFVFPKTSANSYVLLRPRLVRPLERLTVCLRFFTDLTRSYSLFSASSRQHDNEILLMNFNNKYQVCVGGQCITYSRDTDGSTSHWETACLMWNSNTGLGQLWLGGRPLPRKGLAKGYSIPTDLVVMLGQEQDSYGGSLDAEQSFVGEMSDVYMWGTVLPPDQLRSFNRDPGPTPLVDWKALNFEVKGNVVVELTLFLIQLVLPPTSMKNLYPFLLILASLLGSLAYEDLHNQALIFPTASNTAAVVLNTSFEQPLTSFTLCLRYKTLLTRAFSLFSYATKTSDNELLLFKPKPNQYSLYVGSAIATFSLPENRASKPDWEHIVVSWESATGLVELWLDGQPMPRMGLKKGYSIKPEGAIVLGQEQDSVGGGFDTNQSFLGELTDMYMVDRVLTADEVGLVWNDRMLSNYMFNWRSLNFGIQGYVVIKPNLYPVN